MSKIITSIVLLFILNSDQIPLYNINPEKDTEVDFSLSEIASQIKYVKLETNEKCVIARIKKLLIDGEYVFIVSHQGMNSRLFLFTSAGKFVNEIGSTGRGPGQFSTVLDFTLDRSKKIIYILDTMGKIFSYDYSGKYMNTIKLDTRPESIACSNEALFLFTAWPDYYQNKGYAIEIKTIGGTPKDIFLLNRKQIKVPGDHGNVVYSYYFYGENADKRICFLEAKFDTLYIIDSNYNIRPKMVLNLKNKLPRDLFTMGDYNNAMKMHNCASRFIMVNDFLFFTVTTPEATMYFYRLNLISGELLKHNFQKDKNFITNDYDGGLSFKPEGLADNGNLYSTLDCDQLKDRIKNSLQNKKFQNSLQTNELNNLVKNSDYTDNPVIMLVKLK